MFLLVGATFLTSAFVQSQRGHIGIEAFVGLLSPRMNRIRLTLVDIASLAFCAFFAWKSWTLTHEAYVDGQVSNSIWSPPLAIPYALMAAGMTLLMRADRSANCSIVRQGAPIMTVLGIGISYGLATLLAMFSGMPIAFALGAVAVAFMAIYMPSASLDTVTQNVYEEMASDHAAVDPAFHPQRRSDRKIPRRTGSLFSAACVAAQSSWRSGCGECLCLRAVRGHGRFFPRDVLGNRLSRHSRNAQARLFGRLCRRYHRRRRHARHSAAAIDHHDPVRRRLGEVARAVVSWQASARACCWSACSASTRCSASGRNTPPPRKLMKRPAPHRPFWSTTTSRWRSGSVRCRACCHSSSC